MRRPSQRTIDAAVLICRMAASGSFGDNVTRDTLWSWQVAREMGCGEYSPAADLADRAEYAVHDFGVRGTSRTTHAHAADLLESGWLPGDPLVRL